MVRIGAHIRHGVQLGTYFFLVTMHPKSVEGSVCTVLCTVPCIDKKDRVEYDIPLMLVVREHSTSTEHACTMYIHSCSSVSFSPTCACICK